ncbi:DgyrCDS7817 [Dimorphilus gyrociliatus]|nr:DgyrCDS7817 [Dimorphilus gyrociliatus]
MAKNYVISTLKLVNPILIQANDVFGLHGSDCIGSIKNIQASIPLSERLTNRDVNSTLLPGFIVQVKEEADNYLYMIQASIIKDYKTIDIQLPKSIHRTSFDAFQSPSYLAVFLNAIYNVYSIELFVLKEDARFFMRHEGYEVLKPYATGSASTSQGSISHCVYVHTSIWKSRFWTFDVDIKPSGTTTKSLHYKPTLEELNNPINYKYDPKFQFYSNFTLGTTYFNTSMCQTSSKSYKNSTTNLYDYYIYSSLKKSESDIFTINETNYCGKTNKEQDYQIFCDDLTIKSNTVLIKKERNNNPSEDSERICEVNVYGFYVEDDHYPNIAKNKPSWSSSVYQYLNRGGYSGYSVDNNSRDSFWVDGCSVTEIGEREWLIIDLLQLYIIQKIGFVARNGYAQLVQPRSFEYTINFLIDFQQLSDDSLFYKKFCINDNIKLDILKHVGASFFFVCNDNEQARFVRFSTINGSIEICELLIFGKQEVNNEEIIDASLVDVSDYDEFNQNLSLTIDKNALNIYDFYSRDICFQFENAKSSWIAFYFLNYSHIKFQEIILNVQTPIGHAAFIILYIFFILKYKYAIEINICIIYLFAGIIDKLHTYILQNWPGQNDFNSNRKCTFTNYTEGVNWPLFFKCNNTGRISFITGINSIELTICEVIIYGNKIPETPIDGIIYPVAFGEMVGNQVYEKIPVLQNFSVNGYRNFSLKLESCGNITSIVFKTTQPLTNNINIDISPQGSRLNATECNYYIPRRWLQVPNADNVYTYVIKCYKPTFGMYLHLTSNGSLPKLDIQIFGQKLGSIYYNLLQTTKYEMKGINCDTLKSCSDICSIHSNCTGFTFPNGSLQFGYTLKSLNSNSDRKYYEKECTTRTARPTC